MTAIITEKFRLHNATQFQESFSEAAPNKYYMLIGKATPFTQEQVVVQIASPPTPADDVSSEYYVWDQTIAGKNITSSDVTFAVPRRDWANSTTFDMYEDNVSSQICLHLAHLVFTMRHFSFVPLHNRVYKVLDNNGGTAYSGTEPYFRVHITLCTRWLCSQIYVHDYRSRTNKVLDNRLHAC